MTATANRAALEQMRSKLQAMGRVPIAVIGEPKREMGDGTVAVIPDAGRIDETTLQSPREVHVVIFRRYANALREPQSEIEFEMDAWRAEIMEDVFGEFDLGGTIAYPLPTEFSWNYGYQTVEKTMYRLLDLRVSYRIDDNAVFAP